VGESWVGYIGVREGKRALWARIFSSTSSHEPYSLCFPPAGEHQQRGWRFGVEQRGAAGQAGESGVALRTRRGEKLEIQ